MNCIFLEHSDVNATKVYSAGWDLACIKTLLWVKLRSYIYAGVFGAVIRPRENSLNLGSVQILSKLFSKDLLPFSGGIGVPYQRTFHLTKRKHLLIRKEAPTQIIFLSRYDRTRISLGLLWRAAESIRAVASQYLAFMTIGKKMTPCSRIQRRMNFCAFAALLSGYQNEMLIMEK